MSSPNVVLADNLTHARAIIGWLKLDSDLWHANVYGGKLLKSYDRVIMARPLKGVQQEYIAWIITNIVPVVKSTDKIIPMHWSYREMEY